MSFAGFKKQFTKANQMISEKIGNAKPTELESEYLTNEKRIDSYKILFDEMLSKVGELLQPNATYRTKLMAQNALHKFSKKSDEKAMYPQLEGQLADVFIKHSSEIGGDSSFSQTLTDCGDSFKDLEELKYSLEDKVKQNFLEPLLSIRSQSLKEISIHRKKVQSRRLTYDALKRKRELGSKVTDAELEDAEAKFLESKELASSAIQNFLDSEMEFVNIVGEWIKAETEYHHQAADLCESLYAKILARRDNGSVPKNYLEKSAGNIASSKAKTWSCDDIAAFNNNPVTTTAPLIAKRGSVSSVPKCRALFDFVGESPKELSFKEGEVIKLLNRIDENWFEGDIRGKVGYFPINFVEVLVPLRG